MGFVFGAAAKIGSENCKSLSGKDEVFKTPIIFDHTTGKEDYYIFLLESFPFNNVKKYLIEKINSIGYNNYMILSATVIPFQKSKITQLSNHMKDYESNWKDYIDYKNVHAKAIMSFGASLYGINKGIDLMVECFYDTLMNKPYYYLGDKFLGKFNTFIFPVDSLDNIIHLQGKDNVPSYYTSKNDVEYAKREVDTSYSTWKTKFFLQQLINMKKEKIVPDLTEFKLYRAVEM